VPVIDDKGKIRKTYPYEEVRTPYERLKSLPQAESYLRPGVTLEKLETITNQMSDNQFADKDGGSSFQSLSANLKIC